MGYIRHHAIIVTGTYGDWIHRAHHQALKIFNNGQVTGITGMQMNSTQTFVVGPDGSKEGWDISDYGDTQRLVFIQWLRQQCYKDGSSPLQWAEILYGDDEGTCSIVQHSRDKLSEVHHETTFDS